MTATAPTHPSRNNTRVVTPIMHGIKTTQALLDQDRQYIMDILPSQLTSNTNNSPHHIDDYRSRYYLAQALEHLNKSRQEIINARCYIGYIIAADSKVTSSNQSPVKIPRWLWQCCYYRNSPSIYGQLVYCIIIHHDLLEIRLYGMP